MLYAFGFDRLGVVVGDLYFFEPNMPADQQGAEHGVRLELRLLEREELKGSIYSARPITVGRPIWRVDLLETYDGEPGSFDRTHHHPRFREWNPSARVFDEQLSANPLGWLEARLSNPSTILDDARLDEEIDAADLKNLEATTPEIIDVVRRLLERVRAGELGLPPDVESAGGARVSWL